MRHFGVAVLGNGPVGIVAALYAARKEQVLLLAADQPAHACQLQDARVEAVPVSLLALLLEFGIHPHQIGADKVFDQRTYNWSNDELHQSRAPKTVHVHRPALEQALWQK